MKNYGYVAKWKWLFILAMVVMLPATVAALDVKEIQARGMLRHIGVPYANFVTGSGDGLDVELMTRFAEHLGVAYQFVQSDWEHVIADLTGKIVQPDKDGAVIITGSAPIRGDVIANGFTVLAWRQQVISFSTPTFPSAIWLIARADSRLHPIVPTGDIDQDIVAVKKLINQYDVLCKLNTCLDPNLYGLQETGARPLLFAGKLNELAPAIINGEAEATILDVPDALIALAKWPGKIKVIGPISGWQEMACGFAPESEPLRIAFNQFFDQFKASGAYDELVKKYYPAVYDYRADFFEK